MLPIVAAILVLTVGSGVTLLARRTAPPPDAAPVGRAPAPAAPVVPTVAHNPAERLVLFLRRRRGARIGLTVVSVALLVGAGAMIGYPFYTNVYQARKQSQLDRQFASDELAQAYRERRVAVGDSLTRIQIPRLDVDTVVVEGTTASALRAGAGHYPTTPLPCEVGNVSIAGHRTTYGRPFHNLDLLRPGDQIVLVTPIGQCTYEVAAEPLIVAPTNLQVVANVPDQAVLTLTTCHPKGSARQRLVVRAKMVSAQVTDA